MRRSVGWTSKAVVAIVVTVAALLASSTEAQAGPAEQQYVKPVPATSFKVSPGAGATIGDVIVLWSSGAATTYVDLAQPTVRLQFSAEAEQCEGPPWLAVAIDDRFYLGREIYGAGTYGIAGDWSAGRHKITLRYPVDHITSQCDRNLKLRGLEFRGLTPDGKLPLVNAHQQAKGLYTTVTPSSAGTFGPLPGTNVFEPRPRLWSPGTLSTYLDSQGARRLQLVLWITECEGRPDLRITIDGTVIREGEAPPPLAPGAPTVIDIRRSFSNDTHLIRLEMSNDRRTSSCDRALAIEQVQFGGYV